MRLHHPFRDGAWVRNHSLKNGSAVGSAAVVSSLHMCPPIHALSCSFCRSSSHQMKALSRVFVSSAVGGLLGAAAFFAVDGLMPSQGNAQYLNEAGGNIYGDSRINPNANPLINPDANPRINPMANPRINPMANPRINPNANPSINPCGQFGC